MKINIGKQIGNDYITFEVEGSDLKDACEKASKFTDSSKKGSLPDTCGLCGDKNLCLTSYRTREKNFLYVKIVCRNKDCGAFSELGQNSKTTEFYWKPFEKFTPQQAQAQDDDRPSAKTQEAPVDEDLPF